MVIAYALFFILLIMVVIMSFQYYRKPDPKKLLIESWRNFEIDIKYAVLFSTDAIANCISKHLRKHPDKVVVMQYNGTCYRLLNFIDKNHIEREVICCQQQIFGEDKTSIRGLTVEETLLNIWLMYSYDKKYRQIFSRIVDQSYKAEEISEKEKNDLLNAFYSV